MRASLIGLLALSACTSADTDCGPGSLRITDWHDNDTGAGIALQGVSLDAGNGFAVGPGGVVVRAVGGGEEWSPVTSGVSTDLNAVTTSATGAITVGAGGVALTLSTEGATLLSTGITTDLHAVTIDGDQAFLAGEGALLAGPLAGPFTATTTASTLRGVARIEGTTWVVGDGGVMFSGDALTPVDSGTTLDLRSIAFASPTSGVAVGLGGAVVTTVDGVTWTAQPSPGGDLLSVTWAKGTFWATGSEGKLLRSIDGGATWASLHEAPGPMASVDTFEDQTMPNTQIIAVGSDGLAAVYGTREVADTAEDWTPCD